MKRTYKIIITTYFIFPIILAIIALCGWDNVKKDFFSFTLNDIISLICTGYIGIIIMILFSNISNNSMKRREIIAENLTMMQTYSENILITFSNCLNSSINEISKGHITRSLRVTSNEFSNIKEFLQTEKNDNETIMLLKIIEENLINFKQAITDKPFQKSYIINENDIHYATDSHNKLRQNTQQIKLKLYK